MPVFRVEKTKNYTVMANHHLKNKKLSLKAKGLLSMLLSLPNDWKHNLAGYASICKDGVDGVTAGIKELEKNGYIVRTRLRNRKGRFGKVEYTIYELPQDTSNEDIPKRDNSILDNPEQISSKEDEPIMENTAQYNTKQFNKEELNTDVLNPYQINQKEFGYEFMGFETFAELKETVYENIEYEHFMEHGKFGEREQIAEMADLIIETLCSTKPYINIAGNDFPAELVKSKMLKLTSQHIQYVLACLDENRVNIKNIKRYLLATLFNAPSTMDNYYSAKVKYDLGF